jgi:hypothetical protein
MKVSPTLAFLLGACAVFLFSPYLPSGLLELLVGNTIMAGLFLIAALFVLKRDTILGLASFLAVAALFLEHRRRLVLRAQIAMAGGGMGGMPVSKPASVEALQVPAPPLVQGEVHPSHEIPHVEEHGFRPDEETGSNSFSEAPGSVSIDEKQPLKTVPPHSEDVEAMMEEKGFAPAF